MTTDAICCICGDFFEGMGNNPEPLMAAPNRCCDDCNCADVIPARLALYLGVPVKVDSEGVDD